jgi:hypothetical protein
MPASVVPVEMKKKQGQKNVFSLYVTNSVSGIQNASALNFGTSITVKSIKEKTSVYSRSVTGRSLMFGIISAGKNIDLPSIYFSHERDCITRNGQLMAASPFLNMDSEDIVERKQVRFRTVGDMSCTAAVESDATLIDDIISEISASKISERGARLDDKVSEAAMEDRKKGGILLKSIK